MHSSHTADVVLLKKAINGGRQSEPPKRAVLVGPSCVKQEGKHLLHFLSDRSTAPNRAHTDATTSNLERGQLHNDDLSSWHVDFLLRISTTPNRTARVINPRYEELS